MLSADGGRNMPRNAIGRPGSGAKVLRMDLWHIARTNDDSKTCDGIAIIADKWCEFRYTTVRYQCASRCRGEKHIALRSSLRCLN